MLADDVRAEADIVADAECDSDCGFRSIQFSWIVFVCRDFCRFCFVFFVLLLFEPFLILEVTPKYPPTINNECMFDSFVRSFVRPFIRSFVFYKNKNNHFQIFNQEKLFLWCFIVQRSYSARSTVFCLIIYKINSKNDWLNEKWKIGEKLDEFKYFYNLYF